MSPFDQFSILSCIDLWRFDILEDAPIARSVEDLGGQHIVDAHHAQRSKEDNGEQGPDEGSKVIHPLVAPEPGDQCRAKAASGIEAGTRDGRSLPVHERHQNPGHQRGPTHQAMAADEEKHGQNQQAGYCIRN